MLRFLLLAAGPLNLSEYSGIWGGKWCNSSFDPPPPANAPAKPACPVIPGYPIPSFTPVTIPAISSLDNGTISIPIGNSTVPLELKVSTLKATCTDQCEVCCPPAVLASCCVHQILDGLQALAALISLLCLHGKSLSADEHESYTSYPVSLSLQAFNWAGWDDGTTFQGGLYPYRSTLYGDFATAVYRAQLLGFNAVRLPLRCSKPSLGIILTIA